MGVPARSICRAAQLVCDVSLRKGLVLPSFPLNVCVRQHYHFNPENPITTEWSLDVVAPSAPCSLDVCTKSGSDGQEEITELQASQSGAQVLSLCRELRNLQTTHGVQHKEGGRTSVEIRATDAAGRTLVDHAYKHHLFACKADDLLELLAESDLRVAQALDKDSGVDHHIRQHAGKGSPLSGWY
jgi:hypothetical protein